MGTIVKMTCKGCSHAWEGHIGQGMQHGRLENVLKLYPEDVWQRVKALTANERFPMYDFKMQVGCCHNCKKMVAVPYLTLKEHGEFVGLCPDCGNAVQIAATEYEALCPVCGQCDWDLQEIGRWD